MVRKVPSWPSVSVLQISYWWHRCLTGKSRKRAPRLWWDFSVLTKTTSTLLWLTTAANLHITNTLHGNSAQPSISLTVTALGRKAPLKMPTNLSVNIFRKGQILGCIQNLWFGKSSIKSTDDHGGNLISPLQRMCSSNYFRKIALACWLYINFPGFVLHHIVMSERIIV